MSLKNNEKKPVKAGPSSTRNKKKVKKDTYDSRWINGLFEKHPKTKSKDLGHYLAKTFSWAPDSGPTLVSMLCKGKRRLRGEEIPAILKWFGETQLSYPYGHPDNKLPKDQLQPKTSGPFVKLTQIPFYGDFSADPAIKKKGLSDIDQSAFDHTPDAAEDFLKNVQPRAFWDVSQDMFPSTVNTDTLVAIRMADGSCEPVLKAGDVVYIDRAAIEPNSSGIYLISDQTGITLKKLEPVPSKSVKPMLLISALPLASTAFQIPAEDITIIGRAVFKTTRL